MTINETYLGDGVYASFDGYQIWLTTRDGIRSTNAIALEPNVLEGLNRYARKLLQAAADNADPDEAREDKR